MDDGLALAKAADLLAGTRAALILLDVENRFFAPSENGPSLPAADILPNLRRVLDAARKRDVLRLFVAVRLDPACSTGAWRRRVWILRKEAPGAQSGISEWGEAFAPELQPRAGEPIVQKLRMSAFEGSSLEVYLRSNHIETLVLTGVASNGAVLATALDGLSRDFYTLVVSDATVGTTEALHAAALSLIGRDNLLTADEVCRVWNGAG